MWLQYTGPEHSTKHVETKHTQHFCSSKWDVRQEVLVPFLYGSFNTWMAYSPTYTLLCWRAEEAAAGLMAHVPSPPSGPCCCAGVCTAQLCRCCRTSFPLLEQSHSAPSCPANAPKCAGEGPAALPASTAPGSWAVSVHMQTHPTSAQTPSFCILFPAVWILLHPYWRGTSPLKWGHSPSPKCYLPLYASLTASSQPVQNICNVKLLNKYDKCPLPGRAMPKTVSRSLTSKVILFVKNKGKHYH